MYRAPRLLIGPFLDGNLRLTIRYFAGMLTTRQVIHADPR